MYQEWMDGIPLLVPGCHQHNMAQLARAEEYYKNNNNKEMANKMHMNYLIEEYLEFCGA